MPANLVRCKQIQLSGKSSPSEPLAAVVRHNEKTYFGFLISLDAEASRRPHKLATALLG